MKGLTEEISISKVTKVAPKMSALSFCRLVVSLRQQIPIEKVKMLESQGTRNQYARILSEFLGDGEDSIVHCWGKGLEFKKMPKDREERLGQIAYILKRELTEQNQNQRSLNAKQVSGQYMSNLPRGNGIPASR